MNEIAEYILFHSILTPDDTILVLRKNGVIVNCCLNDELMGRLMQIVDVPDYETADSICIMVKCYLKHRAELQSMKIGDFAKEAYHPELY